MQTPVNRKEPILAGLLSLLLAGVGQIYLGQTVKGIVWFAFDMMLGLAACVLFVIPTGLAELGLAGLGLICCTLPILAAFISATFSAIDAFILAQRFNEGVALGPWDFFFSRT